MLILIQTCSEKVIFETIPFRFYEKNSFCESSSLFQLKVIPDKKVTNAKMFCRY